MAKAKRSPEETARRRAEGTAKRINKERDAKAPLFAWAGLVAQIDADQVMERHIKAQTSSYWSDVARRQGSAAGHALADWYRWLVWSLVKPDVFEEVAAFADWLKPRHLRLYRWRKAYQRLMAGGTPMADEATVHPVACLPDKRRALAVSGARWREENERHAAAGCTPERCNVSQRDRPSPFPLTPDGVANLRAWEAA